MTPTPRHRIDSYPAHVQERLTRSEQRIAQARQTLARVLQRLEAAQRALGRQPTSPQQP